MPMTRTRAPRVSGVGLNDAPMATMPISVVPATMVPLSPHFETASPAGTSPMIWPMPRSATMNAARAKEAPSSRAKSGMAGMTTP